MKTQLFIVLITLIILTGCGGPTEPRQPGITIPTTELPEWESGKPGSFTLNAVGGTPPYTWAVTAGNPPTGLNLAPNGVISGINILAPGTSKSISPPFTVTVTDVAGAAKTIQLTITITEAPPKIEILTAVCTADLPCNAQIANARGGTPPYTFQQDTFRQGTLPFGVVIGVDGRLTGSTNQLGAYTFGVCVRDTVALSDCARATLEIEELKEPEMIMETWTATLKGSYSTLSPSNDCNTEFSYDYEMTFTVHGSLTKALEDTSGEYFILSGDEGNEGILEGSISVSRQSTVRTCKAVGGSVLDIPLTIGAGENTINIYSDEDYLPAYIELFREEGDKLFNLEFIDSFELEASSVSDTTISGIWKTSSSGEGTFTLNKN